MIVPAHVGLAYHDNRFRLVCRCGEGIAGSVTSEAKTKGTIAVFLTEHANHATDGDERAFFTNRATDAAGVTQSDAERRARETWGADAKAWVSEPWLRHEVRFYVQRSDTLTGSGDSWAEAFDALERFE